MISLLFWLLFWHALADYPLQGDFLAKAKNPEAPLPGTPWWQALLAHSAIHAGGVAFFTGSIILGLLELIAHALIDYSKCRGWITFNFDQTLHVLCKMLWVYLITGATWG